MMRLRFSMAALLICASGMMVPEKAWTQDKIPKMDALNKEKAIELPLPQDYFSGFESNNMYLEDTLRLQYQISLLEKMIQRQSSISRLEKNYQELGLPFKQPLPPRGICEQIPANIPCYRAYPELYDVVLPDIGQLDTLIEDPLSVDMILDESALADPAPEADTPKTETPVSYEADRYSWTEVLCGGGVCSAVVVKDDNPLLRRTIQDGDLLEGGDITVHEITAKGVSVLEKGKIISLSPARAPAQGGPVSPVIATDPVAAANASTSSSNSGVGNTEPITQAPVAADTVKSPAKTKLEEYEKALEEKQDIVDPGPPPLGPTGLF